MNESETSGKSGSHRDDPGPPASVQCPPFTATMLRRQLMVDSGFWWLLRIGLLTLMVFATFMLSREQKAELALLLFFALFTAGWFLHSFVSAQVARQLPQITEQIGTNETEAEAMIARMLRRRPLQRSVRLLLYHRLAILRHHAKRYAEVSVICESVLGYNLGPARDVRAHLLLMLAESLLQCRDFWGTWNALWRLHRCRLSLVEDLQRLALQTRYEVEAGYDAAALHQLEHKIQMAELMPTAQCGAMHAILAHAARRRKSPAAEWLQSRAELLCTQQQLKQLWPYWAAGAS